MAGVKLSTRHTESVLLRSEQDFTVGWTLSGSNLNFRRIASSLDRLNRLDMTWGILAHIKLSRARGKPVMDTVDKLRSRLCWAVDDAAINMMGVLGRLLAYNGLLECSALSSWLVGSLTASEQPKPLS